MVLMNSEACPNVSPMFVSPTPECAKLYIPAMRTDVQICLHFFLPGKTGKANETYFATGSSDRSYRFDYDGIA